MPKGKRGGSTLGRHLGVWTDERVALLREMWEKGLSASQCSSRLGAGITREAVCGKVRRMGLPLRDPFLSAARGGRTTGARWRARNGTVPRAARKPAQPRSPTVAEALAALGSDPLPSPSAYDVPRKARITDLEAMECRYPVGEPTQGFCALPRVIGLSYCGPHAQRCFALPAARIRTIRRIVPTHALYEREFA